MSRNAFIAFTVIEIVALVAVLAFFLLVLTKLLSRIARNLEAVAGGVGAIEGHVAIIGPGAAAANNLLTDAVGVFGNIVTNAETVAKRARR